MPRFAVLSLAATAMLALSSGAGLAADDLVLSVDDVPQYVPEASTSGLYLRGDVGYGFVRKGFGFDAPEAETSDRRFSAGGGVGYRFNEHFRADLTVTWLGETRHFLSVDGDTDRASHRAWTGLLSGYYDVATIMGVTPYIGAGVGVTHSSYKASIDAVNPADSLDWSGTSTDFTYALMAGASYKVSDKVSLDVGYQFLHTPSRRNPASHLVDASRDMQQHSVRVGLRFDLW